MKGAKPHLKSVSSISKRLIRIDLNRSEWWCFIIHFRDSHPLYNETHILDTQCILHHLKRFHTRLHA